MLRATLAAVALTAWTGHACAQGVSHDPGVDQRHQPVYDHYGPFAGGEPLYAYDDLEPWKHGYLHLMPYYEGYHSFRPYNYKQVFAQARTATAWEMSSTMPYSQQFWHRYEHQADLTAPRPLTGPLFGPVLEQGRKPHDRPGDLVTPTHAEAADGPSAVPASAQPRARMTTVDPAAPLPAPPSSARPLPQAGPLLP